MNLPNKLSVLRIILIPFIVCFYLISVFFAYGKLIALILFLIACYTDRLDGKIARSRNLITVLGTFLDSIADKMLVITTLCLIVADGSIIAPYGVIALIIIVSRELIVSALRQLGASKNKIISADKWGKIKAFVQMICLAMFLLFGFLLEIFELVSWLYASLFVLCYVLLFVTVLLTILSAIHYIVQNKEVFLE